MGSCRLILVVVLLAACTSQANDVGTTSPAPGSPSSSTSSTTATTEPAPTTTTSGSTTTTVGPRPVVGYEVFAVPTGSRPHDVAPTGEGRVWYTAQRAGRLGRLDPATGRIEEISLGTGSAPHGVIVGPDGDAWVTDGGLDAIIRVESESLQVTAFPIGISGARLNTAAFDSAGVLWFTGQAGYYGRFDPRTEEMQVFDAAGGSGPYGIAATPEGDIYYASLAGSHIAHIDTASGDAERIEPPTPAQGARRVWSDSAGVIWVAEWNAGQVGRFDPRSGTWEEWPLPGDEPAAYAVYVDETDTVWLSDFGGDHSLVRFDPRTQRFDEFPLPVPGGAVRQLLGIPGEIWGALSAADALVVLRYEP